MDSTTIAVIGGFLGVCASGYGIITFWMKLSDRISKSNAKAEAAETAANNSNIQGAALRIEMDRLQDELVEHRVAVAKEYVSKETLSSLESRVIDAINNLGQRLDNLFKQKS